MKYIVLSHEGEELLFTFPNHPKVSHKHFAEIITHIRVDKPHNQWEREFIGAEIVAAGFVTSTGHCHGESESLHIASRGEIDTALLKSQYK